MRNETCASRFSTVRECAARSRICGLEWRADLRAADDGVIHPPSAARFLMDESRRHGAEFRGGVAVKALLPEGGVVLADGSRLSAGRSLNAAGPWSPELMPGLPVRKRKGHLAITERTPGFIHHQIVELGYFKSAHSINQDSVALNIQPRRTGEMLIGSSRQVDADGSEVEPEILKRMLARALEYLPSLEKFPSRAVGQAPRGDAGQIAPHWPEPRARANLAGQRT